MQRLRTRSSLNSRHAAGTASATPSVVVIRRSHCNVLGYVHRESLIKAIIACYLAMDRQFASIKVIRKADVVTVNFDISGFHGNVLLGAVLHLMYIETGGVDAAGNELHAVRSRTVCCKTLPVADKTSVDLARGRNPLFQRSAHKDDLGLLVRTSVRNHAPQRTACSVGRRRAPSCTGPAAPAIGSALPQARTPSGAQQPRRVSGAANGVRGWRGCWPRSA